MEGSSVPSRVLFRMLMLWGEGLAAPRVPGCVFTAHPSLWGRRRLWRPRGPPCCQLAPRVLAASWGTWELRRCEALRHGAQSVLGCPDECVLRVWAPENVLFLQYNVSRT